ncbi:MAG TPA: amidase [Acidimicrobiia bacterium]|nr:amidase [Acidimicrobiia bacterium]
MVIGSTAAAAFNAAVDTLAGADRDGAIRLPFDYQPTRPSTPPVSWDAPRPSLLVDHSSAIVESWLAMRTGRTSARVLVEEALAAAAGTVELGGMVEENVAARTAAIDLDAELAGGHDRGPLHGIPITVKDVIDVAGVATRAGSDAYHHVPVDDAVGVARLRAAGAIVIGKAATHEFALGVTSPQSRNPHDPTRIPGGSSGGSVVCVVAGAGHGSLGTDTRASIRVPAALSGAVGFKPTYGRIPTAGVVSLAWTMDHVAPIARSVTDAALMLDALFGGTSALAWTDGSVAGARIGVPMATLEGADAAVTAVVEHGFDVLGALGASVELVERPTAGDLELANAAGLVISRCEAAAHHRELDLDRDVYWDEVREQLAHAEAISAIDYLDAQRLRGTLRDELLGCFTDHDVLAMPTVPVVAPRVEDFAAFLMVLARNAIPWSLVGFPAISVPAGTADGLPVGMQFVAPPGREADLVRVARTFEGAVTPR